MTLPPHEPGAEAAPGYEVIEHLSRGRRLDVYDVWSIDRGCRCVLKAIRPERSGEQAARSLLIEEGRLLQRLTHPHLVRAYEVIAEPAPAIVLETLSGGTVAHLIESEVEVSPVELAHLGLHVGSAIRYLHAEGVLHLDLKPANVVADAGRAKVIDLSVARPPGAAKPGVGTPDYMSPEQAAGGELGPAADVWGIGLLLHEVATGERAFALADEFTSGASNPSDHSASGSGSDASGEFLEADDYRQLGERAPALAGTDRLPPRLAQLIDGCLDPQPERRPRVDSLLAALEQGAEIPTTERRWSRG